MRSSCRRLIGRGLLVWLLLSFSVIGAFAAAGGDEYTWYWWGPESQNITVYGETLASPELTLSGGTISFDSVSLGEYENDGYGVYFRYDLESPDVTEASVSLNSASSINVSLITDDDYALMTGIKLDGFNEAHISLLGNSTVNVETQGSYADSYGIEMNNVSGFKTAEVVIDEGSTLAVKATAIDDNYANAYASGIKLQDDVHAVVNIDNGSTVTVEAKATAIPVAGDSSSAEAYSEGIYVDYAELVDLKLAGGSSLIINATATTENDGDVDAYTGATSVGIEAYGDTVKVDLLEDSTVVAEANAEDEATSTAIRVNYADDSWDENPVNHGEITLDSESKVSAIATANGGDRLESYAESYGVDLSAQGLETAILTVKNGSSITATATATEDSEAIAALIERSPHAVVNVDSGSTLSATATAVDQNVVDNEGDEAQAYAFASALLLYGVEDAEVTLTDATLSTTVTATATQLGETGEARADIGGKEIPGGLWLKDYNNATVALQNTSITVAGTATASGGNESSAEGWMAGIHLEDSEGSTQLSLTQSDIDVQATATAGTADAGGIGIWLDDVSSDGDAPILQLTDSTVSVTATATGTGTGEGDTYAAAYGIAITGGDDEAKVLNLNHSTVTAVENSTNGGLATGLYADSDNVTVNIDTTSALMGTWALYDDSAEGTTTLNNAGTVAGRLRTATLNNASTGILQATFGMKDTQVNDDGISYFNEFDYGYGEEVDSGEYYFSTSTTTLANGTTFLIAPTDNLGLVEEGDTTIYALLDSASDSEIGGWDQEQLKLTNTFQSSLFDMSWDESSDINRLNVKFTFLTPEQAGLSRNGTAAYQAAVKDGAFSFTTDPEEWGPNVSGAFVSGMANTRDLSHLNIGNRMAALMGMNSGDEVVTSNSMWTSVRYTDSEQDDRNSISGFDADTTSFSIGIDHEFKNTTLGFAYTLGSSDADIKGSSDDFDMTDHLFSLYGSYDGGAWYGDTVLSVGFGNVEGKRHVGSDVYKSDYDNNSYIAKVEMGMKFNQQGWQLNPLVAMQYSALEYDSYTEKGSGDLALHVKSEEYDTFTTGLGANVLKDFQKSWGILTPEFGGMLNYDLKNDRIVSTANFAGGNTSFVSKGIEPSETSWDVGTAITVAGLGKHHVSFRVSYDYSGRQDFAAHSFAGKLRFEF